MALIDCFILFLICRFCCYESYVFNRLKRAISLNDPENKNRIIAFISKMLYCFPCMSFWAVFLFLYFCADFELFYKFGIAFFYYYLAKYLDERIG